MATIEEMESSMTVVYNKRLGTIKSIYTGIQEMDTLFGEESIDLKLIWDAGIYIKDDYVLRNLDKFKINTTTLEIEMLPNNGPSYPIAQV